MAERSAAYQREFTFARYGEAVERQQRLLREAKEASERLHEANAEVEECEKQMREALDLSLAEVRVYAKERAGVES